MDISFISHIINRYENHNIEVFLKNDLIITGDYYTIHERDEGGNNIIGLGIITKIGDYNSIYLVSLKDIVAIRLASKDSFGIRKGFSDTGDLKTVSKNKIDEKENEEGEGSQEKINNVEAETIPEGSVSIYESGSGNAYADLNLPNAEVMKQKTDIAIAIKKKITGKGLKKKIAAKMMGISDNEIDRIVRGRVKNFDASMLQEYLNRLVNHISGGSGNDTVISGSSEG